MFIILAFWTNREKEREDHISLIYVQNWLRWGGSNWKTMVLLRVRAICRSNWVVNKKHTHIDEKRDQ